MRTGRVGEAARRWAGAERILYVPGNHEFYGSEIDLARRALAHQCRRHQVTLLDPGAVTIDDIRFIGATLWTGLRLEGGAAEARAHLAVGAGLADFTGAIRHHAGPSGRFATSESARRHAEHRAFIKAEPERTRSCGLTPVLITHDAAQARGASGPGARRE